jgi:hypothetical protein
MATRLLFMAIMQAPADPLTSEEATALFQLRCLWASAYAISLTDGIWVARRRDNPIRPHRRHRPRTALAVAC